MILGSRSRTVQERREEKLIKAPQQLLPLKQRTFPHAIVRFIIISSRNDTAQDCNRLGTIHQSTHDHDKTEVLGSGCLRGRGKIIKWAPSGEGAS